MLNRRRSAFTLIEVMIVIAIVVALGGLVGIMVFQRQAQAKADLVRADLNTLRRAIEFFQLDFERFPTDEEGLSVLWSKENLDPDADESRWKPNLDRPMPRDRWGSEWGYRAEGERREGWYDLWSFGPDKQDGTDDDIHLWEEEDEQGSYDGLGAPGGL